MFCNFNLCLSYLTISKKSTIIFSLLCLCILRPKFFPLDMLERRSLIYIYNIWGLNCIHVLILNKKNNHFLDIFCLSTTITLSFHQNKDFPGRWLRSYMLRSHTNNTSMSWSVLHFVFTVAATVIIFEPPSNEW